MSIGPAPTTLNEPRAPRCACPDASPYACWGLRHDLPRPWDRATIHADGGPCECPCHDRFYEEEDEGFAASARGFRCVAVPAEMREGAR